MTPKIDPGRLYARVARDLAVAIAEGTYPVGRRLPSERELTQQFAVSRPTVREAIIALELDGLVEVRTGSGVYVISSQPRGGKTVAADVGPFELLEARHAIEGEACAMAASRIGEAALAELEALVAQMDVEDVAAAEAADRRFHLKIAEATQNSVLSSTVAALWDARVRSPQSQLLSRKALAAGVAPRVDEHRDVLNALRDRDPEAARGAMRQHLARVLDSLLEATEVEEVERARAKAAAARAKYGSLA